MMDFLIKVLQKLTAKLLVMKLRPKRDVKVVSSLLLCVVEDDKGNWAVDKNRIQVGLFRPEIYETMKKDLDVYLEKQIYKAQVKEANR